MHDALAAAGLGARVVAVGFYQGGASELRLGEAWHHNRLDMVSSVGASGAPDRDQPAWDRRRVMRTVVDLIAGGRLQAEPLAIRRFGFDDAPAAHQRLDAHPGDALKVALAHDGVTSAGGGVQ